MKLTEKSSIDNRKDLIIMSTSVATRNPMTQRAIDGLYIYFVTTNTTFGRYVFDVRKNAWSLNEIIQSTCMECGFHLYLFSILPNHFHLLVQKQGHRTLSELMHFIKGRFWRTVSGPRIWQPRFNFRIITSYYYFENVVGYIQFNYQKMNLPEEYSRPPYVYVNPDPPP